MVEQIASRLIDLLKQKLHVANPLHRVVRPCR
jgi:hypothetical protein